MAKRFTDTDKWKRPWFTSLGPEAGFVWLYILDNCDHCGVWAGDFELLSFQTKIQVDREKFEIWFAGKFVRIEEKYFFPSFVEFQQGTLTPAKNAHRPIIAFLEKHGLPLDCSDRNVMGSEPIQMGPSKGKGISKGISKEGGVGETKAAPPKELVKSEIAECFEAWKETLRHFGMGRELLAEEQEMIVRAIQRTSPKAVKLIFYGARAEPKSPDFKPENYVQLKRYLAYDKYQRFLNLGTAAYRKQEEIEHARTNQAEYA